MTREEIAKIRTEMRKVEIEKCEPGWYYLAFSRSDPPSQSGAFVFGFGPVDAIEKSWELKINPGGSVFVYGLEKEDADRLTDEMKHKLLTLEDMQRLQLNPVQVEG